MEKKEPLIIITGPTAVGKTAVSVELAKKIGGEIISADSMQIYKYMDIGTAKVTKEEMGGVPHYLIDELSPLDEFNVTVFQKKAKKAIETIRGRKKVPIIAGGTGFYIQAVLYDVDFEENDGDMSYREELRKTADEKGADFLHEELKKVDYEAAEQIPAQNVKRVIRALEFYRQTGGKISEHNQMQRAKTSPYDFMYFVLNDNRSILYERIEKRVDIMLQDGLLQEVKSLIDMGCKREMVSMQGIGYREFFDYFEGKASLEEAVAQLKTDTRHFAKRQLTWFRREADVRWINLEEYAHDRNQALKKILSMIEEHYEGKIGE